MMNTKQSISTLFVALVLLLGFSSFVRKHSIKGSGNVVQEKREVPSFSEILSEGVFSVYITQGDKESVTIEADDNLISHIVTDVSKGRLKLSFADGIRIKKSKTLKIYVVCTDLTSIQNDGVGNVRGENSMNFNSIELTNQGVGEISIFGEADEVQIENSGIGSIDVSNLIAKSAIVENNGIGSVEVTATETLKAENSGLGSIKYGGSPSSKDLRNDGLGRIKEL